MATAPSKKKRKRLVLSIQQKLEVIKMLDSSISSACGRGLHLSEYSLIRHGFVTAEATAVRIIEGLLYIENLKHLFRLQRRGWPFLLWFPT